MIRIKEFKRALMKCFNVRLITMHGELHAFYTTGKEVHSEVLGSIDVLSDLELEARFDRWISRRVDLTVLEAFSQLGELLSGSRWSFSLLKEYYAVLEYNHRGAVTEKIYGDMKYAVAVTAEGVLDLIDFINELPLHETLAGTYKLEGYTTFAKM